MKDRLTDVQHWDDNWKDIKLPLRQNLDNYGTQQLHKLFLKHLPRAKRFIEIGAAPGSWMVYFKENFDAEVHGLEYSKIGCKMIAENLKLCHVKGEIHHDDIFNHALRKGSFSIVMSDGLIEHFSKPIEIVTKHYELVTPGGWMVIRIPNLYSKPAKMSMRLHDSTHKHFPISKQELKDYMANLGAEIVFLDYIGGFNPNVVSWAKYNSTLMMGVKKILNIGLKTALTVLPRRESKSMAPNIMVIARKPRRKAV